MEPIKQITLDSHPTVEPPPGVDAPGGDAPSNTELAQLRERVAELDRLASVGQLTAGILHEIKNPLTFITNYARLSIDLITEAEEILARLNNHPDVEELIGVVGMLTKNITRIRENGGRAERIIQGMLAQTRSDSVTFEPTDLNGLLEEFTRLAYQGVRAGDKAFVVSLAFNLDPSVGQVVIAPYAFNRVVLNLVLNACYAVGERAKKEDSSYKPTIVIRSERWPDRIEVAIRDNGEGIPVEVRSKLFSPFFTTKPVGKGTGLGLSLSRDIINNLHKGVLSVESEPGQFTEFTISLPLDPA